jgi:two-component system, chemotaxis family, chemotaxis protein CheY
MLKLKALVVDDSRVMRAMVVDRLAKMEVAEFTFTEAEDGQDALEKCGAGKFDIVFADWNMPRMSGMEFLRALRQTAAGATVPVIMVTSEKTMAKMEEAIDEGGASAFISKPFTLEYLRQKLVPVLEAMEKAAAAPEKKKGGLFSRLGRAA